VTNELNRLHHDDEGVRSFAMSRLRSALTGIDESMLPAIIDRLSVKGIVCVDDAGVSLRAARDSGLSEALEELRTRVLDIFQRADSKPPDVNELIAHTGASRSQIDAITRHCGAEGTLVHIGAGMFLHHRIAGTFRCP
jgi:hypothetical protein